MKQSRELLLEQLRRGMSVRSIARTNQTSPQSVYKWLKKLEAEGAIRRKVVETICYEVV